MGTTPVGILTNNRNIVSIIYRTFLAALACKAFLRPCSQLNSVAADLPNDILDVRLLIISLRRRESLLDFDTK
jgi:hypothetical protein